MEAVLACCQRLQGRVNVYVDMTEAHGYRYHSGVVFALYAKELGAAVAKGGDTTALVRYLGGDVQLRASPSI